MKRDSDQSHLAKALLAIAALLLLLVAGAWWGIGQRSSTQANAVQANATQVNTTVRLGPVSKLSQWVEPPPPPPTLWISDGTSNTLNFQWSVQLMNNPYAGSYTSDLRTWQLRTSTNYGLLDGTSNTITINTTPIEPPAPANTSGPGNGEPMTK